MSPVRDSKSRVLIVGLLGGIASGKSTVARMFASEGATVFDADAEAHACLERPAVRDALVAAFGAGVLGSDGAIDRARLARIAFADDAQRARLNGLVHPCVLERLRERLDETRSAPGGTRVVILDVPLLLETALDAECDARVFVDAPESLRRERAQRERGWGPDELSRREKFQKTIEEKKAAADYMIINDGSTEPLRHQVRETLQKLVRNSR